MGVDLQGPLTGSDRNPDKLKLADFDVSDIGCRVLACPMQQQPIQHKFDKHGKCQLVYFDPEVCRCCQSALACPVRIGKRKACLRFDLAAYASSCRRREQKTQAFKERNNIRAGIEATNSELKRKHGFGRLKVRGKPQVKLVLQLKAIACNLKRYFKVKIDQLKGESCPSFNLMGKPCLTFQYLHLLMRPFLEFGV